MSVKNRTPEESARQDMHKVTQRMNSGKYIIIYFWFYAALPAVTLKDLLQGLERRLNNKSTSAFCRGYGFGSGTHTMAHNHL